MKYKISLIITILFSNVHLLQAKVKNDYELSVKIALEANQGWELYQEKKFVSSFENGKYTDTNSLYRVHEFWSNGEYAKFDSDYNGHHETIFLIKDNKLVYVGSIGRKGTFINVSNKYINLLNKSIAKLRTKY